MMAPRRVALEHAGRLQNPPERERLVAVGMGVDALCVLWSTAEIADFFGREFRSFDDRGLVVGPGDVVAVTYPFGSTEPRTVTPLEVMPVEPDFLQPLSGGGVLVVECRCEWRPDGADLNAVVFGADGAVSRRGCLGDDIVGLQVSRQDTIWAGYGDGGVFGNFGWGDTYFDDKNLQRRSEEPLGASGLVQWSLDFEKISECGLIDYWCEALNVGPDDVYMWPNVKPFMLRITESGEERFNGSPSGGKMGITGGVTNHPHVAVIGSNSNPWSIMAGVVERGKWRETWRGELHRPNRGQLPPRARIEARGSTAHIFVDTDWYLFELDAGSGL